MNGENGPRIVFVHTPGRAANVLALLEGMDVAPVRSLRGLLALPRRPENGTVVMTDSFGRFGLLAVFASLVMRAPLVVRLRGDYFRAEEERSVAYRRWLRRLRYLAGIWIIKLCFRRAGMIVCNSGHLARATAPRAKRARIEVVYNPYMPPGKGEDGESLAGELGGGGLRVLTVTNMTYGSKVRPVMEALSEWVPDGLWKELGMRWVICGGGHHTGELRDFVRGRGLEGRVIVPGRVGGIASLYEWCGVLVYLTRLDAFPNVPMEAMMLGRPVIVNADSDGTREQVFDGVNGFVVDGADSFLAALRAYASDPALGERHGAEGRRIVEERFAVPVQRERMREALSKLRVSGRDL